jgi:hypothetical protein
LQTQLQEQLAESQQLKARIEKLEKMGGWKLNWL